MAIEQSLDRFQKMKRHRVAYVVSELVKRNGEADLREFMGSIASNCGIRTKTQEEYLEELKNYGAIDVMESKIVLKWDMDKAKEWLRKQGVTV